MQKLAQKATNYGQRAEISFGFDSNVSLHSPTISSCKDLQSVFPVEKVTAL